MKLKTKILIGFISAFLLTIIIGYLSFRSADVTITDNLARRNNNNFIKGLKQLSGDFYKIEALESYFVLTGDDRYLNKLVSDNLRIEKDLNELIKDKDVLASEETKKMFNNITENVRKEIKENEDNIKIFKLKDSVSVKNDFNVGSNYLALINTENTINDLEVALESIRGNLNDKSIREARETKIIIPAGSLTTLLVLFIAFLLIRLHISGREKAEYKLKEINESLEKLVSERTDNLNILNKELSGKYEELKQSGILLRESEERYRSLFENMSEGYEYCQMLYENGKPVDWIIVSTNKAFEKLMGLKDVNGKKVSELFPDIHKTDPRLLEINSRVALTGRPEKFEIYVEARKAWFSVSLMSPKKGYFVNIFDIITERKQIENALKVSEERYRSLFENMSEGYAYCRMLYENNEAYDWQYIAVNKNFEKLTGLKDVAGKFVSEVIPNIREVDPELFQKYSRVALTGVHEKFEMYVSALKMWFSISVYSPEKGFFVAVFDIISERKIAEEQIQQSEKRLRAFYESGLVGVVYWNVDGSISHANDKYLNMVGYTREELNEGKVNWIDLTPVEFKKVDEECIAELKSIGVNKKQYEKEYRRKDGSRVPVMLAGAMLDDERLNGVAYVLDITERKQAEKALKESEDKFLTAFRRSPFAMAITSIEDKKYVDVNDVFIKDSGFTREEIIGHTSEELKGFTNYDDREKLIKEVFKYGYVYGKELVLRMKSGKLITCLISMSLIQISGKQHLLSSIVNITERKNAEDVIRINEAKLSNAMQIANLAYWEYDVLNDLFTFNDQFYSIFRTTAEKVGGYTMSSSEYSKRFVHPEDQPMVGIEILKAIQTDDPDYSGQLEHRIVYADGETGYILVRFFLYKDENGRTVKTFGANQDITDLKKTEEKLHEQNVMLRSLIENSPDLIYIKDDKCRFRMASNSVASFMGSTPENLIGRSDFDFYPKELAEKFYRDERNIIESGKALMNSEEPRLNADGSKTWILTTKVPLCNNKENVIGILGISRDITKLKNDEIKIQNLNRVYAVLSNINQAIFRTSDKKKLLEEVCRIIVEDGKTRLVWFGFVNENTNKVIPYAKYGYDNGYLDNIDISILDTPSGNGPFGLCIREDKYVFINNIRTDERMDPWKDNALKRGYNSVCALPLKVKNKVIGAFAIYASENDFFNDEEIKLLEELAADISFALETIELNETRKVAEQKIIENELILTALVNNIPESVLLTDLEGKIVFANETVAKRFKMKREELSGNNSFELVDKEVAVGRREHNLKAIRTKKQVRYQDKRDGRYIDNYINPVLGENGEVTHVTVLGIDVTDNINKEEEIRKSEQLLRFHVENTPLGVIEWDVNFCIKQWNHSAEKIFGYTKEEAIGKHASIIVPAEADTQVNDAWGGLLNNTGGFRSTNSNLSKNGDIITCSWYNTPLLDKDGKVMRVISLVDDITNQVKAENELKITLDERELLLKEIHHRVKNNLQVVASLLKIQSEHVKDEVSKGYFKISADRVRAMALIHQQLYGSTNLSRINFDYYLKNLASHLYNLYCPKPENIKMTLKSRGVTMSIDNAVPCGLLVNEVLTNSLKHAFPENRKGEIIVDLKMMNDEYILEMGDTGIGISEQIDFKEEKTLGVQLIQMLVEQLDATMEIDRTNGTLYKIKFSAFTYKKRV